MVVENEEQTPKERPIFRATAIYRNAGEYFKDRELFDEAKWAYNFAYQSAPDDIEVLIGRSRLFSETFHPRHAVKDATDALAINPRNLHALRALADANYSNLEFEKSVTLNYRGLKQRRKPSYFSAGVKRGLACVNDTIGKSSRDIMTHYLPLIKKHVGDLLDAEEPDVKKHKSRIPYPKQTVAKNALEIHQQQLLSRVLAFKYLGPMAYDKFFLQKLTADPRLKSANKQNSQQLKDLIEETLRTLNVNQDMLHAQCLYYTLKQIQKTESQHQNKYKKQLLLRERETNRAHAEQLLQHIEKCRIELRINDLMKKAQLMQKFLDSKSNYNLPEKNAYTDRLYTIIGNGYLSQHRLSNKHSHAFNHRRVSFVMGLNLQRTKSVDSVITNFPQRFCARRKALQNALSVLETAENPNMKCWLHYEIAQLYCALKNYPMSKFYAQGCQREAQQIGSAAWWLNGCFAMASSGVQQGNENDVRNLVTEALEWSKSTGTSDATQRFLQHCVELANEVSYYDAKKDVNKRQKDILNVMDGQMRSDTQVLFNKMSSVPVGRRFPVLPQKSTKSKTMESARTKYWQKHMTIVPGPVKALPRMQLKDLANL